MKKEIIINVCGITGSGKSTVGFLLKEYFSKIGSEVEFNDIDEPNDYEHFFNNLDNYIEMLKTRKIIINGVQLPIKSYKHE